MKHIIKQLQTTFNVLFAVQVAFCAVALFFIRNSAPPTAIVVRYTGEDLAPQSLSTPGILVLVFLLSAVGVAFLIDNQRKAQGAILQGLVEKVEHYRQTSIIRLAMVEAANILAIIIAIKENNMIYLAFVAVGVLFFLRFRPTTRKFIRSYQLNDQEIAIVRQEKQ